MTAGAASVREEPSSVASMTLDGAEVAIKKLKTDSRQGDREFRAEADIISRGAPPEPCLAGWYPVTTARRADDLTRSPHRPRAPAATAAPRAGRTRHPPAGASGGQRARSLLICMS
ncbi:hypothetical protein C2845_PM18G08200 [Panicum miliaceum]|uniref:Uncharacterized protein n=1 Tax=Panicum miliaceum TaxID=4540 RepID=A0A3L6PHF8_PANMI|nr:hypothetical protein C2845_PM18G08200 [Panicum miliaceum]